VGKSSKQTQTVRLDPTMERFRNQVMDAANVAANARLPGMSEYTRQAIGGYQGALGLGNKALAALGGDAGAFDSFYNPYQTAVVDRMMDNFGRMAAQTSNAVNDQATKAGSFGGTRHGVAEGIALGQLNTDRANQLAALEYQGFNDAQARALNAANLGLGAAGALSQLGDYARQIAISQDPALHRLATLQGALAAMPYGTTQTQKSSGSIVNGLLGGVATLGGLGLLGPIGGAVGGAVGGLFGGGGPSASAMYNFGQFLGRGPTMVGI